MIVIKKERFGKLNRKDFLEIVNKTPLVAIDLIIRNSNDEVLIGLRKNEPARNTWYVPGGIIRKNEKLAEAFEQICLDEIYISLSIDNAKLLGIFEHFYDLNFALEPGISTHYIVLAYEITISEIDIELPKDQHSHYKWLKTHDLINEKDVHLNVKAYFQ